MPTPKRGLVAPGKRAITLKPVRPNLGIEAAYRARLEAMVDDMQRSIAYWLKIAYRANTPEIAKDESPAAALRAVMNRLASTWQRKFDEGAAELAKYFTEGSMRHADTALRGILRNAGFSVEFKLTRPANDALQAVMTENVGLIKSIASEHLSEVEGMVMRSVARGRDLGTLTDELTARYDVTRRRAAFIARDQNNKATAVITAVRQKGLGIKLARWRHSRAGAHPRKAHVAVDGKTYDIEKGMLIDGRYVFPGEDPNCRCTSQSIIPGLEDDE